MFDILRRHPELVLLIVIWLLSAVFGTARKARQRQARRAAQAPRPAPRDPEEIARELRRMMGLETEPRAPRPAAPAASEPEPEPVGAWAHIEEPDRGDDELARTSVPVGQLHDEIESRRGQKRWVSEIGERHVGGLLTHHVAGVRARRGAAFAFDSANPEQAVVALEVLGPPRALRGWDA